MKLKQILAGATLLLSAAATAAQPLAPAGKITPPAANPAPADSIYLMAYFTAPQQHLFYAWSNDGLNWQQANDGKPIFNAFDDNIWMRDPYLNSVTIDGKTTYHLVHTWGWDNPAIFHWQSDDLLHWTAANGAADTESGRIYLMDGKEGRPLSPNAWAPEFTYVPEEQLYYVYWSSRVDGRQLHYVATTPDWLTFSSPQPLFDPGFTAIDLTVVRHGDTFYGFYKDERDGKKTILAATSATLAPGACTFGDNPRRVLPDGYNVEVEGPTVFPRLGGNGYIGYFDKFIGDTGLSYITCTALPHPGNPGNPAPGTPAPGKAAPSDLSDESDESDESDLSDLSDPSDLSQPGSPHWELVPDSLVTNVPDVKHGSVIAIPRHLLPL